MIRTMGSKRFAVAAVLVGDSPTGSNDVETRYDRKGHSCICRYQHSTIMYQQSIIFSTALSYPLLTKIIIELRTKMTLSSKSSTAFGLSTLDDVGT
jgi:hypothetical protein